MSYRLELPPEQKRVFVTQLRDDDEDDDEELDIQKIPIVKEKAGQLVEMGFKTLQKTLLLKREAEVNAIDLQYVEKKQQFQQRILTCKQKETELKKRQQALKDRMEKFQKYTEENDAKKARAFLKYQQESKIKKRKVEECKELQEELKNVTSLVGNLKSKLKKYQIFEEYLIKVIDALPESYIEATDNMITALMMRYETLELTNFHLTDRRNDLQTKYQQCIQTVQILSIEQSQDLLICNKELAVSQDKLERLMQRNALLEMHAMKKKENFITNSETKAQIILAIENLSDKCQTSRTTNENLSLFQKLDIISQHMIERQEVYEMSKPYINSPLKNSHKKSNYQQNYKSSKYKIKIDD